MNASLTLIDAVAVALAAATLVVTGVGVFVAILAAWGYRDLRNSAVSRAEFVAHALMKEAIQRAEDEARRVAGDIAAREMRAFLDKQCGDADISAAYQDRKP